MGNDTLIFHMNIDEDCAWQNNREAKDCFAFLMFL
jgi:hypothetical protein